MNNWQEKLNKFIIQAHRSDLKTSSYPKELYDLRLKISFGMGAPARVPWIAFIAPEMAVSKGFYPVYLYYKNLKTLILAYGISETEEYGTSWPTEITNSTNTIASHFDQKIPRYGNSLVFKSYKITLANDQVKYMYSNNRVVVTNKNIKSDLLTILDYYKKITAVPSSTVSEINQGLFYMEKQLEDFLIHNWPHTELGKKYDLIIEEGVLMSQQYKTAIGSIDILVKDKKTGNHVVIELKKNQTSDDTAGQLARYMGWVKKHKKDKGVRGIIIAGQSDKKLMYALDMFPNTELLVYEVDFKLKKPS
ncbi:endonuclease NucS domain-containing protein [Patescibacteria group bacterium]